MQIISHHPPACLQVASEVLFPLRPPHSPDLHTFCALSSPDSVIKAYFHDCLEFPSHCPSWWNPTGPSRAHSSPTPGCLKHSSLLPPLKLAWCLPPLNSYQHGSEQFVFNEASPIVPESWLKLRTIDMYLHILKKSWRLLAIQSVNTRNVKKRFSEGIKSSWLFLTRGLEEELREHHLGILRVAAKRGGWSPTPQGDVFCASNPQTPKQPGIQVKHRVSILGRSWIREHIWTETTNCFPPRGLWRHKAGQKKPKMAGRRPQAAVQQCWLNECISVSCGLSAQLRGQMAELEATWWDPAQEG